MNEAEPCDLLNLLTLKNRRIKVFKEESAFEQSRKTFVESADSKIGNADVKDHKKKSFVHSFKNNFHFLFSLLRNNISAFSFTIIFSLNNYAICEFHSFSLNR